MKKTYHLYADFETLHVDIPSKYKNYKEYYASEKNPKVPKVYDWCVLYDKDFEITKQKARLHKASLTDEVVKYHRGISGESFIKFCENLDRDVIIYFNNLRSFDGHFIIPLLDKLGYKNVLPMDIKDHLELDPRQEIEHMQRVLDIKEEILSEEKHRDKYDNLLSKEDKLEYLKGIIKRRWNLVREKQYSVLTDKSSKIYEIKIGVPSTKKTNGVKRNRAIIIRDNMYLFPSSVKNMGTTIAKQHIAELLPQLKKKYKFKRDKLIFDKDVSKREKETIKYTFDFFSKKELKGGYTRTELYKSIKEFESDGNELEYLIQDTYLLWKFHKEIEKYFPRNKWKLTIGATAYNSWIETLGKTLTDNCLKNDLAEEVFLTRGAKRIKYNDKLYNTKQFSKLMINKIVPSRWLENPHNTYQSAFDFLYQWFGGGLTLVNEKWRGKFVKNITYADKNSSYPSQMVKDVPVPYGRGVSGNKKNYPFKFYKLVPKKRIFNKRGLPFLFNELAERREYSSVLEPFSVYRFTSISLENFLKYYDANPEDYTLTIEYSFKQMSMNKFFDDFINHWYKVKSDASEDGNEILKFLAKLYINNVFGKFGTKLERISKIWNQFTKEWVEFSKALDSKYYLPLAIAITEYARKDLVDATDQRYDQVVYLDTDSLSIIDFDPKDFPNMEMHKTKLGAWDIEFANGYGIYRRSKQYILLNDKGEHKIAYSGINFNRFMLSDKEQEDLDSTIAEYKKITLHDYINGKQIDGQLTPYRLIGEGIVFEDIEKSIKPIWDYDPLPHQEYYNQEHFMQTLSDIDAWSKNHNISIS